MDALGPLLFIILFVGGAVGLCSLVGGYAERKGYSRLGFFFLSLFTSPLIGFIVAALMTDKNSEAIRHAQTLAAISGKHQTSRRCPYCAEFIQPAAIVCKHCGRDLEERRPAPRKKASFYYSEKGTVEGPFSAEEIHEFLGAGVIGRNTPLVREGEQDWKDATAYQEINA